MVFGCLDDSEFDVAQQLVVIGTCSDSQTSRRLRTNIVLTPLTFGENIAPAALTIRVLRPALVFYKKCKHFFHWTHLIRVDVVCESVRTIFAESQEGFKR
jgi:hypothetical protein